MKTKTFRVRGMTCGHRVAAIRRALHQTRGVHSVTADLPTGVITVTGEMLDDTVIVAALAATGHEVTS